jgi:hypothetical protein
MLLSTKTWAQPNDSQPFFVFLNQKAPVTSEFLQGFHPNSMLRRQKLGISFPQWSDLPFHAHHLDVIVSTGATIRHELRWIGAVSINASDSQINEIIKFDFVDHAEAMNCFQSLPAEFDFPELPKDTARQARLYHMVRDMMQLDTLQDLGLTGKGVRIAVFDAGFTGADTHGAFDHLRNSGRIETTCDFYGGKTTDVYHGSKHGTAVLGCLAGISHLGPIGAATEATYLLARTEHNQKEKPIEEDHWMAAAEWADRLGVDIISSSLGYAQKRYSPQQMDGLTSKVSHAAAMAVRKGILVVNSAGNEGQGKFRTIATPADADSVLSVGASYPMVKFVMPFSSTGPNARGVLKPEISAPGYVFTAGPFDNWVEMPGTSFACPLVAGVAACLWQANSTWNNMQIREKIIQAGHFYPYFDAALGNGVLDARYLFVDHPEFSPTFKLFFGRDSLFFVPDDSVLSKGSSQSPNGMPLHIANIGADGKLIAYTQMRLRGPEKRVYLPDPALGTELMRIWWQGYLMELKKNE